MANIIDNIIDEIDEMTAAKSYLCDPESCKSIINQGGFSGSLKILTQNIRSINRNINSFKVLLARIDIACDLYILTETWNSKTISYPSLMNYDTYHTKYNRNQNDGLVIYVKNSLDCIIEEPIVTDATILCILVKPNIVIIAIYRSPSTRNISTFIESFDKLLTQYKSYQNIVIIGDINIDIKVNNDDTNSAEYLNLLSSHGIIKSHSYPTRCNSCLDHSMVKSKKPIATLVLNSPLTDHSAVITCLKTNKSTSKEFIIKSKVDFDSLLCDIQELSFDDILKSECANWAAGKLVNLLSTYLTKHSTRLLIPKKYHSIKPWITAGLVRCMRNRDRMHLKSRSNPNNVILATTYKRYKNTCNDLLRTLSHFSTNISDFQVPF
ncbi:unnamed protein product [Euphydryas editha]|uniref:Tick transposon n=1 Tax=Euphydryas editha TaxID=104508 RepID=A0AAU9V855_EUPED|nr:unnamed protein product [Euphydryas editha]